MSESDVVVITGASGGIGAALAKRLGRDGKRLVLAARRESELRSIASDAEAAGAEKALAVPTDVMQREAVNQLRDAALKEFGRIDVWVNNAGRGLTRTILDVTDADLDDMITVNLKSALYGMQAVSPHFIERGKGHLINVSSFLSRVPMASIRSAYSASKAALNSLTANLRMDLAATHPNIHVSLVMPGLVSTAFAQHAVHGTPPIPPGAGAPSQTAEAVAAAITAVIDHPVAEIYTNPPLAGFARTYFEDVEAFEAGMRGRS